MNTTSTRRSFLKAAAFLPLALAGTSTTARGAYTAIPRHSGPHLRPSLNVYSFLELLNANAKDKTKGLDLFGACDFCAKVGFDAIDLTGYFFPGYPQAPADDYLIRLKRHAFNLGLAISGTQYQLTSTKGNWAVGSYGALTFLTATGGGIALANCHPFAFQKWMFMHNGQIGGYEKIRRSLESRISDEVYNARVGTTDSEAFFYLLFGYNLDNDPVAALTKTVGTVLKTMTAANVTEPFRMTAALTDGETLYALRYATDPEPPTLFFSKSNGQMMVVSEPLDAEEGSWTAVENAHILVAKPGQSPFVAQFSPN